MTAVVTRLVCKGRQTISFTSTGTVTLEDKRSFAGTGEPVGVPRSDRRIKMAKIFCMPCHAEAGLSSAQLRPLVASRQTFSTNSRSLIDGDEDVICFCPRGTPRRHELGLRSSDMTGESPVKDLRTYEYTPESDDDYRHRMLVNFLATMVLIVLMVTGRWMVDTVISSWPG